MEIKDMKGGFVFPHFSGMSAEARAAHDAKVREIESRQKEQFKIARYQKSGVPERYWTESIYTFTDDTPEREEQAKMTREFIHAVNGGAFRSLIFLGAVGTGKTHLACAAVRECGGLYRTAMGIVEEIRRAKSFTAYRTEADILRDYARVRLLVIDEIGRGKEAQEEQYMIYQIVNERYNTRKPTILISNHRKKDFLNYIGVAAADRLIESAYAVEFTGESYRAVLRGEGA